MIEVKKDEAKVSREDVRGESIIATASGGVWSSKDERFARFLNLKYLPVSTPDVPNPHGDAARAAAEDPQVDELLEVPSPDWLRATSVKGRMY